MRRQLAGCRAIVTGASSGIGKEISLELARQGARLVLTARRAERLDELASEIKKLGVEAHAVAGDIADARLREKLLEAARAQLGGLDLLVNNAGIGAIGPFAEATSERLRQIMEVNFFAPAELTRTAIPLLSAGTRPMIVNVSSVLGHRAVPKKSEYCASKFALHGLSDSLRCELAPRGIDVLLVSPSTTATEFFDSVIDGGGSQGKASLPWLNWGQMSSRAVAKRAVRAIRKGRHEIILTPGGKLLVWFDRLMPPIVNRLVARFG
jgi:short-subunit dehydrogenase